MNQKLHSVPHEAVPTPQPAASARDPLLVDVVALTGDPILFQSARDAVGERNPVWRARSADEAADLLITGRCGVLLVDMAAVSTRADTLIEQIVDQFPDVVVCVAGTREDEPMLAPLISNGLVYRFLHKPTSARRAGMFLQAAIRRHVEKREGIEAGDALAPLVRSLQRPTAGVPRGYLAIAALVALSVTVPVFIDGGSEATTSATAATPGTNAATATVAAPATGAAAMRSDPILSRARAALQAGRLEAPEGRNALDLFQAVLLAQPDHPEAQASLARTIDLLLQRAQQEAAAGQKAEADRLVQRVLAVVPAHAAAQQIARQLNPPDSPSRQLSREQEAEVEAQVAALHPNVHSQAAAPTRTLAEIEAELARLPGPVTQLTPPAAAAAAHSAAPAPAVVRPDPLAPRYVNPSSTRTPAVRTYAPEPVSRAPAAGLAVAPVVAAADPAKPSAAGSDLRQVD